MTDVARRAGVSQTTVSFVINRVESATIPVETQDRVWAAVDELGYRPNAIARGLRKSQTHTIGFISEEVATSPFAGRMIQGAQDAAADYGRLLLLVDTGGDPELEARAIETLLERQVDGLIYAAMYHRIVTPPSDLHEVASVLLDARTPGGTLPAVFPDEEDGGFRATTALLRQGHRRIGYLGNLDDIPAAHGRDAGYHRALATSGVEIDEELVVTYPSLASGGFDGTMALLDLADPPTALFCFNDRMAMGAYQAIAERGLRIPDDLAVVGFDNQEVVAAWLRPALTTMELPHYEMGRWAVEHLFALLENPEQRLDKPPVQHAMPCPLIERESI
jgi:LacI family transcriptional regulator